MDKGLKIEGKKIYLRAADVSDATDVYVSWLNDPEVNQYLEIRFSTHTIADARAYITKYTNDENTLLLAIIRKDTNTHIGNIKLGPINPHHKYAEMALMIGDKSSWSRGFASEAITLLAQYAFTMLGVHKIIAGAYRNNIGSIKVFQKCGFSIEYIRKSQYLYNGKYIDAIVLTLFNESPT